MAKRISFDTSETPRTFGKVATEPGRGKEQGLKRDLLDITALIRSIQRAEGNPDCFGRANGYCNHIDCAWYTYCLEGQQQSKEEKT